MRRTHPADYLDVDEADDLQIWWRHRLLIDGRIRWWGTASLARRVPAAGWRPFAYLQVAGRHGDAGALVWIPGEERDLRWYRSRVGDIWAARGPGYEIRGRDLPARPLEAGEDPLEVADGLTLDDALAWAALYLDDRSPPAFPPWIQEPTNVPPPQTHLHRYRHGLPLQRRPDRPGRARRRPPGPHPDRR